MDYTVSAPIYRNLGKNAIAAAVRDCGQTGGGTVVVPKGEWESAAIVMYSHVHIQLEDGARVTFSNVPEDYLPIVFTRWEGTECYNYSPLIYARGCKDIAITGDGTLYGNGESWWSWKKLQQGAANTLSDMAAQQIPVEQRRFGTREAALRPSFIQFIDCKNVLLEGFTIEDGPQWTLHPVYCDDVMIRGVTVRTAGHNTDGLNPDSCKNVLIENCSFCTGDDCIAINAGLNEDGWRVARPCEHIEVRNCTMTGGHGALTIGSAVSGGVSDIYMHDCKVTGCEQGIRMKSMRGRGGYVRNVRFENIKIDGAIKQAIQVNMFYESSTVIPHTETPTDVDGVSIRNVSGRDNRLGIQIKGLPEHPIRNLSMSQIHLQAQETMACSDVRGLTLDVNLEA